MRCYLKSIMLLAGLFLATQNSAHAQLPVRLGIDAGMNFANQSFSIDDSQPKSHRLGFIIGGLAEVGISDLLFLQAEPRFIQKGIRFLPIDGSPPEPILFPETFEQLSYLEIPLLLKARFGNSELRPFVLVGPNVGFLLSAIFGGVNVQNRGDPVDIKDQFIRIDLSFDLGVGLEYRLSEEISLIGNARYSRGLNNISSSSVNTIKSNGIQITFASLFNL